MRIVQVIPAFYPCRIWGGPPQNTLILAKGLQQRGHQIEILTSNVLDAQNRISEGSTKGEWEGVPVTYLQTYWRVRQGKSVAFMVSPALWRFRELIRDADLVHIHGYRHFLFNGAAFMAICYRTPFVIQARGTMTTAFGKRRLKRFYDRTIGKRLVRGASAAIALSRTEQGEYATLGVPHERTRIIYNSFDPGKSPDLGDGAAFRKRYEIGPDEQLILFLARLHERKGLDLLISAVSELTMKGVRLIVAGPDHGYAKTAKELAAQSGIAHISIFTGPLYGESKYDALRASDLFVLPSLGGEGLPTTVIEACFTRTPILITDVVEAAELVDGVAGLSVPANSAAIAHGIRHMLGDPDLLTSFQEGGAKLLKRHFDPVSALDHFQAAYSSAIAAPAKGRVK